jgi:hypothetical protein
MKKLMALGAALAAIPAAIAGAGRGAAAYLIATQECWTAADGSIQCVAKDTAARSATGIIILIAIGVGIYLWQKKKKK